MTAVRESTVTDMTRGELVDWSERIQGELKQPSVTVWQLAAECPDPDVKALLVRQARRDELQRAAARFASPAPRDLVARLISGELDPGDVFDEAAAFVKYREQAQVALSALQTAAKAVPAVKDQELRQALRRALLFAVIGDNDSSNDPTAPATAPPVTDAPADGG